MAKRVHLVVLLLITGCACCLAGGPRLRQRVYNNVLDDQSTSQKPVLVEPPYVDGSVYYDLQEDDSSCGKERGPIALRFYTNKPVRTVTELFKSPVSTEPDLDALKPGAYHDAKDWCAPATNDFDSWKHVQWCFSLANPKLSIPFSISNQVSSNDERERKLMKYLKTVKKQWTLNVLAKYHLNVHILEQYHFRPNLKYSYVHYICTFDDVKPCNNRLWYDDHKVSKLFKPPCSASAIAPVSAPASKSFASNEDKQ